jgi:large subunit ribosomal protein L15
MQYNTLKRTHANKKGKTVGRGGTRGKTAGRGTKGQNARAGHKKRPEIRDFIKRIPKLRGRGKNINTSIQSKSAAVNLSKLEGLFAAGSIVSPQSLAEKKIISVRNGVIPAVKILGTGTLTKNLSIEGCMLSATARAAVEKAGGSIK